MGVGGEVEEADATPLSRHPTFHDTGFGKVPCRRFKCTAEYEETGSSHYNKNTETKWDLTVMNMYWQTLLKITIQCRNNYEI